MTYNQVLKTGRPCKRSHSPTDLPQRKWRVRTASPTDPGYPLGGIPSGITTYTRDIRGLITGQNNSNGTNSAFYIDSCRRTTYINHIQGSTPVFWIGYAHDLAGNPLVKTTSGGTYTSVYDPINQLIYHQTPSETQSLTYDGAFRRIQQLDALGLTEFNYNAAGQLMTATGARPATCTYDDNGNTTTIETAAGLTSYAWDDLGRLSGATLPGNQILTMTHRFDNLLTSKAGPNGIQTLLWDGQNVATASGPSSVGTLPAATAVFVGIDTTTQGNWRGAYGSAGFDIISNLSSYPSYITVSWTGVNEGYWTSSTTDVRALEAIFGRIAANFNSDTSFTVDIDLANGLPHKVSIYCLDWDETTRSETVQVLDANSGAVLDTQSVSSFHDGVYLSWTITGHIQLVFTNTNLSFDAVVSGLFIDFASKALFLDSDATTQGNWQGVYGADGYNIIEDAVSYPSYALVSETGASSNTWTTSTSDVRALEQTVTGRIAADWYSDTNFTVDIRLTDGEPHKLSIYCLDWDTTTRAQTVQVQDAFYGTVLDTQTVTSFNGGVYLSWTIQGHVQLVFTNTGTPSAVVSGLFFDSYPTPPTGGYGMIAMGAGLTRSVGVDANGNPVVRQYHMDSLGSVVAITDGQGNLVTNYQIDAWGNVLSGGAPGNAFDFLGGLGYWADPDLGLHYVRARWMNPQFGNWLSVDPHLDEFAYQYANNMPTTSTDASGKDPDDGWVHLDRHAHDPRLLKQTDSVLAKLIFSETPEVRADAVLAWKTKHPGVPLPEKPSRGASSQAVTPSANKKGTQHSAGHAPLKSSPAQSGHPGATAGPTNVGAGLVRQPLPPGVLTDVAAELGHGRHPSPPKPVAPDFFYPTEAERQKRLVAAEEQRLATQRRMAALRSNPALMKKVTAANTANIDQIKREAPFPAWTMNPLTQFLYGSSASEYIGSVRHHEDAKEFLRGVGAGVAGLGHAIYQIGSPSAYPKAIDSVIDAIANKGVLGAAQDFKSSYESSLQFWDKPDMRSTGESFFNMETFVAPFLKGVKLPPGIPGASVISGAVFRGAGSVLKATVGADRTIDVIKTVAERSAPLSNAFGRRGTFWSGPKAFDQAGELAATGQGIRLDQTAGGAFMEWLDNAGGAMNIGEIDLGPAWEAHSGEFASTVSPKGTRAVLRGVGDVPVPRSGHLGTVFEKTEYPKLVEREIKIEYVEAGDMGLIRQMPAVIGLGKGSIVAGNVARLGAGGFGAVPTNHQPSLDTWLDPSGQWFHSP